MRKVRLLSLAALLAVAAAAFRAARADDLDVPALFGTAKASFEAKKYGKTLADLNLIAGEVGRLRLGVLQERLPAAPTGWTADEPEGNPGMGMFGLAGMSQVTRRYAKGEETSIRVEVYADAGTIVGPMQMMLANAGMMGIKVVMIKGRKAVLELRGDAKSGSLTVLLNSPNSMVKFDGNGVTKADLEALANAFDLDALEKAIAE
jgi:hypothetical protein